MPTLSVLCWGYTNRLDERGGWGFSVHPNEAAADFWLQDTNTQREFIRAGMNAISVPYLCGRAHIESPSHELTEQLGDKSGIFVHELGEPKLHMIHGMTPNQVTDSFLDEMNSGPD